MAIRVAIIGAGGYTGAELVSLLAAHPGVDLVGLFGGKTTAGSRMSDLHPRLRSICDDVVLPSEPTTIAAASPDVVFLATPHEASHDLAPVLLEQGWIVIDLSAAFRLSDPAQYPIHYRFEHRYPELLSSAVYGLPELNRDELRSADLIAAPGCYATAATLAIAPFAQAGQISSGTRPIIDGVSGVSGAGRTPNERTHFCNISLQPYAVGQHRHTPEIAEHARTPVVFTPHLAEYERGMPRS
ncbi:MAG: N-acetyl-gamma-glutamyl-phosphate reductase, partial [Planctomycetota bacterium]